MNTQIFMTSGRCVGRMMCMRLQLFADPNTQTTTSDGLSAEMKTFYDKALIDQAEAELRYNQFGQERDIPKNGGKTIEFRKFSTLPKALTPLTEGVTPDGQSLEVSKITSEVRQYGKYVTVSDVLDLTAIDPVIVEATKMVASQAANTLDTVTREVVMGGTNVFFPNGKLLRSALTKDDGLTRELVIYAAAQLKANNAPTIDGSYVGIVHPYCSADLMASDGWMDVQKYKNPEKIYEGEIGKLGNVRFVESSEAKIWKDDTCPAGLAVFGILILGDGAYGRTKVDGGGLQIIIKQRGSAGTADPLDQRSTVGWKALHTAERLLEENMVRLEVCSEFSDKAEAND